MTLTNRLSLFFLTALAVVLIAFSVALYFLADRYLTQQVDDRLEAVARTLASASEVEPDGVEWEPGNRPFSHGTSAVGDQLRWAVTTDECRTVDRSPQPETEGLLAEADRWLRAGHRNPRKVEYTDRDWRVFRLRLAPELPPGTQLNPKKYAALVLTVAVPLDPLETTLQMLAAALAGLTVAVLAIALFASRAVCRRALAPVARMADAARSMGAADLTDRLPSPSSADELADLGKAFNGLLERLGEAFERERQFAGEASHQLRTPLAALLGQVEVALRRDRDPEEYRRVLDTVHTQGGRLRRVVEALLFLARSEAEAMLPEREPTDLASWVSNHLQNWGDHPRAGDLRFESSGNVPIRVAIHPDLFGEMLDALIDNALKYSAAGTPVVVRVGRDERDVWVEVEDRGSGISRDELPHLFRPFFRSDAARRQGVAGAGLGLAVAARIAAAHCGSIAVESEPGHGSRFCIRLAGKMSP